MSWLSRFKNAWNPRRLDADLSDEMGDHIERRAADLQRRGLSQAEAHREAVRTFGNLTGIQEASRELRMWGALEGVLQDVRYAWRTLIRNPAFAITAVVSLGLAVGAIAAIYTLIDAALLRPLPLPYPDQLLSLADSSGDTFGYLQYEQLLGAAKGSARLALFDSPNRVEAKGFGDAPYEMVTQQFVSPDAFEVLGVPASLGTLFSPSEDRYPGPRPVVVLSYSYWQRRFGGDPAILGRTLTVDGRPFTILGVARKGFSGVEPGKFIEVWLPVTMMDPGVFVNNAKLFHILGRLSPGANRESLGLRLQITALPAAHGVAGFRRTFSRPLWILFGVSACIMLIASANLASLVLARAFARAQEMALRISLGARRMRLIRQLLTESLVISLIAVACGYVLTRILAPVLLAMVGTGTQPVQLDLTPDTHVLIFCAVLCTLSTLIFGLLPALQATSVNQPRRLQLSRYLVGIQVAFAFCLVTGGAAFLFSLRNLAAVDKGFDEQDVTVLSINSTQARARQLAVMQQLRLRAAALPEVQGAATAWMAVLSGTRRADRVVLPGKRPSEREETFYRVSPGYFATMRTPLLAGRDFRVQDNDDEPVATVVNVAFAQKYFGSEQVLGREFRREDGVRHQVVGLSRNSRFESLRGGIEPIAYMPMKPPRAFTMYVRSRLDPVTISKMVQREAAVLGSDVRVSQVTTLEALVGSTIRTERLLASIGGAFGLLGLILAATGLFGLLNYTVTRRTREIGIRVALGAKRGAIYKLVLRDISGLMAAGLAGGLIGALGLLRVTGTLLFGLEPVDPLVVVTATLIFLSVSIIAAGLPARRAAAIDPAATLKN